MSDVHEQIGHLYLGRLRDSERGVTLADRYLYEARDLVTHGVIVGQTGSGKTGLGIVLIEEVALAGIPVIAIDPKGDLGNLLLAFPSLDARDLLPWIDEHDAAQKGLSRDELAALEARRWRDGWAAWGLSPERIARLTDSTERVLFTPGSGAGRRLGLLRSFDPPSEAIRSSPDAYRERLSGTTAGVLALAGIDDADVEEPARVLLAAILDHAWSSGRGLSLADLVHALGTPPIDRVGVMDVESFFPARARFSCAMKLNALLAGSGTSAWTEGDALDIDGLLRGPSGKPRISILSIAHLGDRERMFFVTTLLSEIVTWMRSRSGSTSLRALLYLDEAMGYLPPVANPPSKPPMLTLLKQARAFGLGVVLSTQNPVDLDYKALSNAGTWFLGRLQTERDRLRVIDALEHAAQSSDFDRADVTRLVGGLGPRQFLAHGPRVSGPGGRRVDGSVPPGPIVFETRWASSYLRGPLTLAQIASLPGHADSPEPALHVTPMSGSAGAAQAHPAAHSLSASRPALPPEIEQYFVPARGAPPAAGAVLIHFPALLGVADLGYVHAKLGVDLVWTLRAITALNDGPVPVDWTLARTFDVPTTELADRPPPEATFAPLCREATLPKRYPQWQKSFVRWASQSQSLRLLHSPTLALVSRPGESREAFLERVRTRSREILDRDVEALRGKSAPKIRTAADHLRAAETAERRAEQRAEEERVSAGFGIGSSIVGALLGRKVVSAANVARAGRVVRGARRLSGGATQLEAARQATEARREKLRMLESALERDLAALQARQGAAASEIVEIEIKPRKSDVHVTLLALVWVPFWRDDDWHCSRA